MAAKFHIVKVKMAESEGNLEESEDEEIQRILDARHAKNPNLKAQPKLYYFLRY